MKLRAGTRSRPQSCRIRSMCGAMSAAWNPASLPGTPREWLAGPDWCYTDGSAAFASASSQYLSVASNSTLQTGDVDFWVAGWVNLTNKAGNQTFAGKMSSGGGQWEWVLYYNSSNDRFQFAISTTGSNLPVVLLADTFGSPSAGVWYWVQAWHDSASNTANISVNAGAADSVAHSGGVWSGTAAFRLGYDGGNGLGFHNGNLASVAFGKSPPGGIAALATTIRDRLYASGAGIVYADTTTQERTDWGLVSWWDLVRSGVFTDSHGTNNLTNNNGVTFGAGLPRARAGDTDPISAWVDRWQGTTVSQSDPLRRPTLRLVSGKWAVRFDGVNDNLVNAAYSSAETGGHSVGAGFSLSANGSSPMLFVSRAGWREFRCGGSSRQMQTVVNGSIAAITDPTAMTLEQVYRGIATSDFVTDSAVIYRDGVSVASGGDTTVSGADGLCIGNRSDSDSFPFPGDIYSAVYGEGRAWAPAEVAQLDAYLAGVM